MEKAPFCDHFLIWKQFHYTEKTTNEVDVVYKIYVEFLKSTMFKGQIEKSSYRSDKDFVDS